MKIKKLSFDSHIHKEIKISSNLNTFTENDDKIISLGKGFYFHFKTEQLFCDNVEIDFTKTELRLFKLLVINLNNITKIDEIANLIWRNKFFSRTSLRAYIKKIRDKTHPNLIVTKSNIGYKLVNNI